MTPDVFSVYKRTPANKASDLLVQALEHEGVEYVFGVPGESSSSDVEAGGPAQGALRCLCR